MNSRFSNTTTLMIVFDCLRWGMGWRKVSGNARILFDCPTGSSVKVDLLERVGEEQTDSSGSLPHYWCGVSCDCELPLSLSLVGFHRAQLSLDPPSQTRLSPFHLRPLPSHDRFRRPTRRNSSTTIRPEKSRSTELRIPRAKLLIVDDDVHNDYLFVLCCFNKVTPN